jgi:DNA-binding transcriptional MerR regulator
METYLSISEVCKNFETTSRTLRFYEKEGLIKSIRNKSTQPRKYTLSEVEKLRKILIMRSLNLPIKDIKELFLSDQDVSVAIQSKMAVIKADMIEKEKQLRNLERAVTLLMENRDIFELENEEEVTNYQTELARKATERLLAKDYKGFTEYFANHVRKYLSFGFLTAFEEDMKQLNGTLLEINRCSMVDNEVHVYISGSERTLLIKYIFHSDFIVSFTFDSLFIDCRM